MIAPAAEPPAYVWSAPATNRFRGSEAEALADAPALVYQHPGANPYKGTSDHAFDLLYPAAAPYLTRDALAAVETRGFCRFRAWHQGEIVDAMVFGHGQVAFGVVVDVDDWPATASHLVEECTDGSGNALILPRVCGNWSFERVPPFPHLGGPPVGEGWTPVGEASQEGSGSDYSDGWGEGGWLAGGGELQGAGGAAAPAENVTSASFEGAGASVPVIPAETEFIGTPGGPGGSPPTMATPEPSSLSMTLAALALLSLISLGRRWQ